MDWLNTNKLLKLGFQGVKTGVTQSAGPCLSSYFQKTDLESSTEIQLLIVVLKCKSLEDRFHDTQKIL